MADPKSVVERHVETFNARDVDASPWSDDADFVAPNGAMHGREEVMGFFGVFWNAFPDGRLELSNLFAPKDPSSPRRAGSSAPTPVSWARRRGKSRPREGPWTSAGCRVTRCAATS